jgi:hypothetical protein
MRELHAQERGLELVEPARIAELDVHVLARGAVVAQEAHALRDVVTRREDHAAVAAAAEILRGVERQRARVAPRRDGPAVIARAHRLGGVGDHGQPPPPGHGLDLVHRGRVTVQVHRHHGARPRRHGGLEAPGIEIVRLRVDVDEDGHGPEHHHGARGGHEGERRRDHLVARTHAHGLQGEEQGVGPGVEADAVTGAAERGQLRFERLHLGAQNEATAREHARGGGEQLARERRVLAHEVDLRDHWPAPTLVPNCPMPSRPMANRNSFSLLWR